MKQLRITAWALLLSLMLSLLPVTALAEEVPAAPEAPLTQEAMAQTIAETAMTYGGAASVQYALWQDGRIVYAGHAGDLHRRRHDEAGGAGAGKLGRACYPVPAGLQDG